MGLPGLREPDLQRVRRAAVTWRERLVVFIATAVLPGMLLVAVAAALVALGGGR